jgi:hypothetical protein
MVMGGGLMGSADHPVIEGWTEGFCLLLGDMLKFSKDPARSGWICGNFL